MLFAEYMLVAEYSRNLTRYAIRVKRNALCVHDFSLRVTSDDEFSKVLSNYY